jgi:2-keto-4-pentenoate hydratase
VSGQLGWKAGFGSPAALEHLAIERPLVARLPGSGLLPDGATVSLTGWTKPVLEVEVAIWIGRGLGVAIELVDIDFPPDDVERILACGIYHRHVLLGPPRVQTLAAATARVTRDGEEVAVTADLTALTGEHDVVLDTVRDAAGRDLRDGEVVIAGAVMPPFPVEPGQRWSVELGALGALSVGFAAASPSA